MMKRRIPDGFTIVELLVVIAIIALLVGLLLPAVNRARATARQTQCINNQKQLGTAVQTYFTSKGRMPEYMSPGRKENAASPGEPFGWVHPLLPNIGQANLYDQILDHAISGDAGLPIADFIAVQRLYIELVVCPADPPINTEQAAVSYAPNAGRDPTERPKDPDNVLLPVDWPENGAFGRNWPMHAPNQQPTKNSIEQITRGDGTTRTMLLAENVRLTTWNNISNPLFQAIMWKSDDAEPTGPLQAYAPPIEEEITTASANALLSTPSSKHTGGFIAAFCDGHVDYISNEISYSVFARLMSSNGGLARPPGVEVRDLKVDKAGNPVPEPLWQKTPISDAELQ